MYHSTTTPEITRALVSPREAATLTGLSRSTLWRLSRRGEFPRAIRISPGRVAYELADIREWLARCREHNEGAA